MCGTHVQSVTVTTHRSTTPVHFSGGLKQNARGLRPFAIHTVICAPSAQAAPSRGTIKPGYTGDLRSLTVAGKDLPADVKTLKTFSSRKGAKAAKKFTDNNLNTLRSWRLGASQSFYNPRLAWSICRPGPMVVDTDTFFINTPLAVEGLALFRSTSNAVRFSFRALTSKSTRPIGQ